MRGFYSILALLTILSLVLGGGGINSDSNDENWRSKVDPLVFKIAADGEAEFLVLLREQADLREAFQLESKLEKGQFVFQQLTEAAERTQEPKIGRAHV